MIRLLLCGDVVGRSGRQVLVDYLPGLKDRHQIDIVVVNAENAAHGFGITGKIVRQLREIGVDVITTGNHVWDNDDAFKIIQQDERLIRPGNYPVSLPGKGHVLLQTHKGYKVLVVNLMGNLFMAPILDSPVPVLQRLLSHYHLPRNADDRSPPSAAGGEEVHAILVDFHAETTGDKQSFARYFDGRVSAVIGTHTHVPTADERILPGGTGFLSDVGMCGDYSSVIGWDPQVPIERFVNKYSHGRLQVAEGPGTLFGVLIDVDTTTGKTVRVERLREGHPLG